MVLEQPLSNLQLELLKMYSHDLNDKDLIAVQRLLANFFAERATKQMDTLWDKNSWSNETMDAWLSERS
jgi:hypothetical protein